MDLSHPKEKSPVHSTRLSHERLFRIVITFLILTIVLLLIRFLVLPNSDRYSQKKTTTIVTEAMNPNPFTVNPISIDPESEILYGENSTLYQMRLDGQKAQKIATFKDYISDIKYSIQDDNILLETQRPERVNQEFHGQKDFAPSYNFHSKYWKLNASSRTPVQIKNTTIPAQYFTQQVTSNSANIMYDKQDGSPPVKIGVTSSKIQVPICEAGCLPGQSYKNEIPHTFTASPDGSYLMNNPSPYLNGDLGTPGIVLSRDGSRHYPIDFNWYGSWAIWIDNNKLLTDAQGKIKLFTFYPNGNFTAKDMPNDLFGEGFFADRTYLSPDKKYLYAGSGNLLNLQTFTIEKLSGIPELYINFLGWSRNSKNILLSQSFYPSKVFLINLPNKKTIQITKISTYPMWLIPDHQKQYLTKVFAIR